MPTRTTVLGTVPESAGLAEESNGERKAARKAFFAASIALSFLLGAACGELAARVRGTTTRRPRSRKMGWQGVGLVADSARGSVVADDPRELRIVCAGWECDFSGDRPLPVIGVDERLYRRLPTFLIATAD